MGKKRGKGSTLTAVAPMHTRDLEQVTSDMIAWYESGYSRDPLGLPAVYASVRLIASTINQLPIEVDNGEPPEWLLHPRRAGSALDLGDLIQYVVVAMALRGQAYLRCYRLGGGSWRIDALHHGSVQVHPTTSGIVGMSFTVDGREWEQVPDRGAAEGQYILHIPYLVTPDHPEGLSPITAARLAVGGYMTVEGQAANLLDNGTYSGGRLESEQDITPATALRYQQTWVDNRKVGKLPVLGAGLKYVNDLVDPSDAQWLESRQYNNAQVAMMFGIPPDYLGMAMTGGSSSLSYNNSQDNDRRFRRNCLAAFTQQISDALSLLLPPGRGESENQRLVFDYTRWEGEGDADGPDADGAGQPAMDDQGQPGREPDDPGDSGSMEQADHLRRTTGELRTGSVRPEGSDRETTAVVPQQGRADRAYHRLARLIPWVGDHSGHPADDPGERRDDPAERRIYARPIGWVRPDRTEAGEGRGPVHESPTP